jgi:predicted CXXCH cytochrome family protein
MNLLYPNPGCRPLRAVFCRLVWCLLLATVLPGRATAGSALGASKHNLTPGGRAGVQGLTEADMCKYCHTPHGGEGQKALWNQTLSAATYIPYSSSTMKAPSGQPTGDSKLCLSCHDGTVALGAMRHRKDNPGQQGFSARMAPGRAVLGTDLSDDHPVSFSYSASLAGGAQLKPAALLNDRVRLDANGEVQCTSCHDPHSNQNGKFLAVDNHASALCLSCHAPPLWSTAGHRNSTRIWNGVGRNPWPGSTEKTVAGNACGSCHTSHHAGTHERLLQFPQAEDNCLVCHSGSVAAKNIAADLNKPSAHPVLTTSSLHDAAESPINNKNRHATCVDCHNPHAATGTPAMRPNVGGALAGVAGISINGARVNSVTREYELCFRCHADSVIKGTALILRQTPEPNIRRLVSPANASYHPLAAIGKSGNVPSLIAPLNPASILTCTDCHNSDQSPAAGGAGPNGPHGSVFAPLLERQLELSDNGPENYGLYALCYKCHSRESILSNQSFKGHSKHIVDVKTACTTCHDPHGVASSQHLINFNLLYVQPSNLGRLEYNSTGQFSGNCTLKCHGFDHNRVSYP